MGFIVFFPWLKQGIAGDGVSILVLVLSFALLIFVSFSPFETFFVHCPKWSGVIFEWSFIEFTIDYLVIVFIYSSNSLNTLNWRFVLGNGLLIYLVMRFTYMLFGRYVLSQVAAGVATFLICGGSFYVQFNRGTPLYPWDIFGIPTLATVSGATTVECNRQFIISICILALSFMTATFFWGAKKCRAKDLAIVVTLTIVFGFFVGPNLTNSMWNAPAVYGRQGAVASYIAYTKYILPSKPKGYSKESAEAILKEYEEKQVEPVVAAGSEKPVNIIVIMNEAWSDLTKVGEGIDIPSPMSFTDSLRENTIKGNMYSSVKGGGTCNTEFEVLTGFTTAYYAGYPYVSKLHHETKGLNSLIKSQGFNSEAFHPFMADNWSRPKVYKNLGFDKFISIETLKERGREQQEGFLRSSEFASDTKDFEIVMEDEAATEGDSFIFNVTMQNHTEFTQEYLALNKRTDLSEYGEFPAVAQYFDLMYETDKAFEELITYYKDYDEPTMILMFGDHQPAVEEDFYQLLMGKPSEEMTAEDVIEQYVTPFVLWTNYEMESAYIDKMSANYLGLLVLDAAGIPKDGYWNYMTELFEKYPVISAFGCYDCDGNFYQSMEDLDENILTQYKQLMHHRMSGN